MTSVLKTNKKAVRLLSLILAIVAVFCSFSLTQTEAFAASKTPVSAYAAVKKAYGSSFPLSSSNRIQGSNVLGVASSNVESYYAAQRVTGGSKQAVYEIYICKAKSGKKSAVKSALKKHLKNEKNSMNNYLSSKGKKLFKKAKVGTKGNFVYLVMIDTSGNSKAVKAIKKALS